MKKMLVVSLVLAAALVAGCSKKQPQTMPTGGETPAESTEMKKDGDATGGATYGGEPAAPSEGAGAADPCAPQ